MSQNFVTFQVLEPKSIVSHKTRNIPEAFEMQSGKNYSSVLELSSSDLKQLLALALKSCISRPQQRPIACVYY